jgi:uncharacterized protein
MDRIDPYRERTYRTWSGREDLLAYCVRMATSDLRIQTAVDLEDRARALLAEARGEVEAAAREIEGFAGSLVPVAVPEGAGPTVSSMAAAARAWGVGPMAAVAGAIAQAVGEGLMGASREVIVENGGDIYLRCDLTATVALYAGEASPFRDRLAFELDATRGIGVCTSSAVVGPSLSLGRADAVMAVSPDCALADAAATSIANRVSSPADVDRVIDDEAKRGRLDALVICCGDKLGVWGNLELAPRRTDEDGR